jgi:hypothetical protein
MTDRKKPASDLFVEAFRAGVGSTDAICELCGRHVFGRGSYEEGELEALRKKAQEQPDKYVDWTEYDGVSLGEIDGKRFVLGCCPENLRKYEDWILAHRRNIVEYLKTRAKERLDQAKREAEHVEGVEPA